MSEQQLKEIYDLCQGAPFETVKEKLAALASKIPPPPPAREPPVVGKIVAVLGLGAMGKGFAVSFLDGAQLIAINFFVCLFFSFCSIDPRAMRESTFNLCLSFFFWNRVLFGKERVRGAQMEPKRCAGKKHFSS
jgi:hypothetical protein